MKTEHDWRDVLLKAASIVEEGWCQEAMHRNEAGLECYRDNAVQSCATGALHRAFNQLSGHLTVADGYDALYKLQEYLRSSPGMGGEWITIALWNDHPDRTATEVAKAMRQAAT